VLRIFTRSLLLLLCCWLLTGPQLLLQLGAWSWMIATYSQESGIEQAFQETFGGDRPCELCKIIKAVEDPENETPQLASDNNKLQLMLGLAKPICIPSPRAEVAPRQCIEWNPESAHLSAPTPPPRVA
jgi:hypothetical protein